MAKQIKTKIKNGLNNFSTVDKSLHSDHHPQLFGKTLIWNIDKDNPHPDDLEMKAYAIAQKMNKGDVTSGMLQEVPNGSQDKLIAYIEKYLDPKQKLEMRYKQNGTHPFGNLTFSTTAPSADQGLENEVSALQQKYEDSGKTKGQVLVTLVSDEHGKKRLLVNVHAETPQKPGEPPPRTPRVDLKTVLNDIEQFRKNHQDIDVVMGGDMNNGPVGLPRETNSALSQTKLRYQHSEDNSAFKKDGTAIAVDAVFSSDHHTKLEIQPDMNENSKSFLDAFAKSKKEKEELAQKEKMRPVVDLQQQLESSPFKASGVQAGSYRQKISQDTQQDFSVKLTFQDARQARQFTNFVSLRDKKNLFQNENEIYLTQEALAKISKVDMKQPTVASTEEVQKHQSEKPIPPKPEELQQKCVHKIKESKGVQISAAPSVEYKNSTIRQDTRGEVDYSMQITFASKEEARAFSDAMGYRNKTLLFQDGNKVYIAKDAEADFLKKMSKQDNTHDYKTKLEQMKSTSLPLTTPQSVKVEDVQMTAPKPT